MAKKRIHVSPTARRVYLPEDRQVMNLIEYTEDTHPKLGKCISLPYCNDVTKLLRNLGYIVPAPITRLYNWSGDKPWRIQKVTAALLTMNRRAFVLSEMGTGKTRSALYAIDFMLAEGDISKALIIAPLSTLSQVWDREIFQYFNHLSVGVLHGSREKRLKILSQPHDIYVINHDGVEVILPELIETDFDAVIIDELSAYKNARTARWKAADSLISKVRYVWGMTGSPIPNAPTDAYGQAKLLVPKNAPRFFKRFQNETMVQVTKFKWVPRKDANDRVYELLQPGVRYTRNDCVEIPETLHVTREVPLSKKADKVYKAMMNDLTLMFQEGEIRAVNEGVLCSKLLQIASGYVYTRDKKVVDVDSTPRLDEALSTVQSVTGKVIIFANFTPTVFAIHKHLTGNGVNAELVYGQASKKQRDDIFGRFQNEEGPQAIKVIVADPRCMSHGLTLTRAHTIIWFSPSMSLETYEQACARITRPGQTEKQLILHLTGTPIEAKIYARLRKRASLQGALLEMFDEN